MSHCSTYDEAVASHSAKHIAWLEENHWDTFYNKDRNFPDAEERKFDGLPSIEMLLYRGNKRKLNGMLLSAKFLPGTNTCMLSKTKRELQKYNYCINENYMLADSRRSYQVKSIRYNEFPKYPILELIPLSDDDPYLRASYHYVIRRTELGLPVYYAASVHEPSLRNL